MGKQATHRRRPLLMAISQSAVRWFFRLTLMLFYRIRVHGLSNYPSDDRMLVCANHQSFLDPIVLGVVCPRPVNYLGRKTLFKFPPLAWFLTLNDTIPIDREATGIGGMKETLRRLKKGEAVVMFPEGTRSRDGNMAPLMLGFSAVAKRSKATLTPIGLDGPHQAFPRDQKFPRLGSIHVVIGKPIEYSDYESLTDQETADLLESRIQESFQQANQHWQRSVQKWQG